MRTLLFEQIEQIIVNKTSEQKQTLSIPQSTNSYHNLQLGISYIVNKQFQKFVEIAKQFTVNLAEYRKIYLRHQFLIEAFDNIKFIVCKNMKVAHSEQSNSQEYRGFVIVGKAVSVCKTHRRDQGVEHKEEREQLTQLVQQGITKLVQEGKYLLPKHQKIFSLNDILLHHDLLDLSLDQAYIGNQVYSPFVPLEKTIVMFLPYKFPKPECFNFMISSLLHIFTSQINLISKIMIREEFFRGLVIKGIYFVEEGEVSVKSGRIIVRGWTTYGKCKVSGFGWKFKPIPFIRVLIRNSTIWKQFFNDILLNGEYPYSIENILGLTSDQYLSSLNTEWKSLSKKKLRQRLKSPKLRNKIINEIKLEQIDKMKHYDDRFNDIYSYKQDLLARKLKGSVSLRFQPVFRTQGSSRENERKKKYYRTQQLSKKDDSTQNYSQPENILIMSVLKKLSSMDDMQQKRLIKVKEQFNITEQAIEKPNNQFVQNKIKKQNMKIPLLYRYKKNRMHGKNKKN